MGKGSRPRPRGITREEADLRWLLATGTITLNVYSKRYTELKRAGLIQRSGRVLK